MLNELLVNLPFPLHVRLSARELGVDMTPKDWKSLLEVEYSAARPLPLPSPSPTNQSEVRVAEAPPLLGLPQEECQVQQHRHRFRTEFRAYIRGMHHEGFKGKEGFKREV